MHEPSRIPNARVSACMKHLQIVRMLAGPSITAVFKAGRDRLSRIGPTGPPNIDNAWPFASLLQVPSKSWGE